MSLQPREIDTSTAPEHTTSWADAVDGATAGNGNGNARRCWADESECLSPEFAPINFPGSTNTKNNGLPKLPDPSNRFFPADDDLANQYSLGELHPPYNAFVGGLAFNIDEQALGNFFTGRNCKVYSVRLPREDPKKGKGARSKGFGYVEFMDAQSLKLALAQNGSVFGDRKIKVDIADRDDRPASTKKGGSRRKGERERDPWSKDPPRSSQKGSGKGLSSQSKSGRGLSGSNDWFGESGMNAWSRTGRGGSAGDRYDTMNSGNTGGSGGGGAYGGQKPATGGTLGFGGRGGGGGFIGDGADGAHGGFDKPVPTTRLPLKLLPKREVPKDASPSHASAPSEAPRKKVDPFGGAKPRDELDYERRRAEEATRQVAQNQVSGGTAAILGPPVPAPQEAAPVHHTPPFQPQGNLPPPPQYHPVPSGKKKIENVSISKPGSLPPQQQPVAAKDKRKQDTVNENYGSGWAANDWDWNSGGWSEARPASRAKGGATRSGKGKKGKGKGRGGKQLNSSGYADQDVDWRNR